MFIKKLNVYKGKIGPRELRKAFKQLGETVSEEEIVAMVSYSYSACIFFIFIIFQIINLPRSLIQALSPPSYKLYEGLYLSDWFSISLNPLQSLKYFLTFFWKKDGRHMGPRSRLLKSTLKNHLKIRRASAQGVSDHKHNLCCVSALVWTRVSTWVSTFVSTLVSVLALIFFSSPISFSCTDFEPSPLFLHKFRSVLQLLLESLFLVRKTRTRGVVSRSLWAG